MQYFLYIFFLIAVKLIGLLPFKMLYIISDGLSWFLFRVVGYRKSIILNNLRNSFPDKSALEIASITRKVYTNISDLLLESIKGFSMRSEELEARSIVCNPEILEPYFEKNINIIATPSHYANWEWSMVTFNKLLKHKSGIVYKPLTNKYIDAYLLNFRTQSGSLLVPMNETRSIFKRNTETPLAIYLASDQTPSNPKKATWLTFFNQDTPCLGGADLFARVFNLPVFYVDVQRVKRGYYETTFHLITDKPKEMEKDGITKLYMQMLEDIVRRKPEDWLWSHRRWKHKYQQTS